MKKILLSTAITFLVLSACNNESSTADNAGTSDSNTMENTGSDMVSNNVVGKTGITLSASQEVPTNNSSANGTADVSYNKDNHMLTYTVKWSGLTGEPSMAHIHGTAAKGVNAGVKHDLSKLLSKSTSGSFSDSVMVDGSSLKEDSLLAGFYYFNVHTPKHPGGEIRGQIEF
ncbi:MAG: CHRD domain-containing protein [Chitinophagaceae bacterium]